MGLVWFLTWSRFDLLAGGDSPVMVSSASVRKTVKMSETCDFIPYVDDDDDGGNSEGSRAPRHF